MQEVTLAIPVCVFYMCDARIQARTKTFTYPVEKRPARCIKNRTSTYNAIDISRLRSKKCELVLQWSQDRRHLSQPAINDRAHD